MEAPKCQKIPGCGNRHYGDCDSGATGERPDGSSRKARPKKAARKKPQPGLVEMPPPNSRQTMRREEESPPDSGFLREKAGPKKKSIVERKPYIRESDDDPTWIELIAELLARVESLEARVLELESRKKYMREYQRARRAEEKGDG